jgi:hypothetical protein
VIGIVESQFLESQLFCKFSAKCQIPNFLRSVPGIPCKNLGIPKIGDKKSARPSSQIPFFTYKWLAEFSFEACQIRIIQTHPNSSELPNLVIWVT